MESSDIDDGIETMKYFAPVFTAAAKLAAALDRGADKALPKKIADIIKLHSKLGLGSALIPVPGADVAAAVANVWTMYVRISKELNLPLAENILKSVASGVATNLAGAFAMRAASSTLKSMPDIGTIAEIALAAASRYALTMASGILYMNIITRMLERKVDFSDVDSIVKEALSEKDAIKEIVAFCKKMAKYSK
ncbi:MAG: hypothetical protein LBH25_06135 [Fibromonadaceae bacterium]|jgi:uncharacterized protein (DUF697 family)|nr:hypothetical protein [Fibromonadaceae bacterium]